MKGGSKDGGGGGRSNEKGSTKAKCGNESINKTGRRTD